MRARAPLILEFARGRFYYLDMDSRLAVRDGDDGRRTPGVLIPRGDHFTAAAKIPSAEIGSPGRERENAPRGATGLAIHPKSQNLTLVILKTKEWNNW